MTASEREELVSILVGHGCASLTAAVVIDAIEAAGFVIAKPAGDEEIHRAIRNLEYAHATWLDNSGVKELKAYDETKTNLLALIASRSRPVVTEEMVERAWTVMRDAFAEGYYIENDGTPEEQCCRSFTKEILAAALGVVE